MNEQPRRLGVLGGTFDPIHAGHVAAAAHAADAFALDRLLFVPAGEPWQRRAEAHAEDRFLMATLAVAFDPRFAVSRLEIDRRGPTYTADTLALLKQRFPATQLFFIAGADAVARLGTWHRLDELPALAEVIAVSRPGSRLDEIEPGPGWPKVHQLEMEPVDISATDVRRRIHAGLPVTGLVPTEVERYVQDRGLYARALEERP